MSLEMHEGISSEEKILGDALVDLDRVFNMLREEMQIKIVRSMSHEAVQQSQHLPLTPTSSAAAALQNTLLASELQELFLKLSTCPGCERFYSCVCKR